MTVREMFSGFCLLCTVFVICKGSTVTRKIDTRQKLIGRSSNVAKFDRIPYIKPRIPPESDGVLLESVSHEIIPLDLPKDAELPVEINEFKEATSGKSSQNFQQYDAVNKHDVKTKDSHTLAEVLDRDLITNLRGKLEYGEMNKRHIRDRRSAEISTKSKTLSKWGPWQTCQAKECGSAGIRIRTRICLGDILDQRPGAPCRYRKLVSFRPCRSPPCSTTDLPTEQIEKLYRWSEWSQWSGCSSSCGGGMQSRTRICGENVTSSDITVPGRNTRCWEEGKVSKEQKNCSSPAMCYSIWGPWQPWSACKLINDSGIERRERQCVRNRGGDSICLGESVEIRECFRKSCVKRSSSPPLSDLTCGIRSSISSSPVAILRIFGGRRSSSPWPWQAAWQMRNNSGNGWIHSCGGTLIHPRWVVTAAHCIKEADFYRKRKDPGLAWSVVLGMVDLHKGGDRYYVDKVFLHEEYSDNVFAKNDIALLKLRQMVPLTDKVSPICMPGESGPKDGESCFITGWGFTERFRRTSHV